MEGVSDEGNSKSGRFQKIILGIKKMFSWKSDYVASVKMPSATARLAKPYSPAPAPIVGTSPK